MNEYDIQLGLPWKNEESANPDGSKEPDSGTKESVTDIQPTPLDTESTEGLITDIQPTSPDAESDGNNNPNIPQTNKADESTHPANPITGIEEKISSISNEGAHRKVLVPDEDRENAQLIYNILKKREGWETGSWSLFKIAESLSNGKLSFNEVGRLRRKYCKVDHKRAGKNYYVWNDKYVFNESELEEGVDQQTQKDGEPTKHEDWWNYMGPITSSADALDRWSKDKELREELEEKNQQGRQETDE